MKLNKSSPFLLSAVMLMAIASSPYLLADDDHKKADLAGKWYSASPEALRSELKQYLDNVPDQNGKVPLAVIVPHAGYQFSGPVAAYSFKALQGRDIESVVLIGFCHRKQFDGIAVYDRGSFETPLGVIEVDAGLADNIMAKDKRFIFNKDAFSGENSIEMEIPFIQMVLPEAKIVPIAFGTQGYGDAVILANALAEALKDRKDVVVIASTDLSHYHPYDEANSIDGHMIKTLGSMDAKGLYDEAQLGVSELCGIMPVTAVLIMAEKLGYKDLKVLKYANSGDTYGQKERVVGYLSAAIYTGTEEAKMDRLLNDAQRKRLLAISRESIVSYVRDGERRSFENDDPILNEEMGAFVTLHEHGELRGCIGNMVGNGPLYKTIADMAVEAATGDPRFPVLKPDEIDKVDIEISVLSPMKRVDSYQDVKIPGHGVMVRSGFRSGVYLPQVADETGWDRDEFLTSLCAHKAGLRSDAWKDQSTAIYVFTAEVFGEKEK